jgi:hypothetical protein
LGEAQVGAVALTVGVADGIVGPRAGFTLQLGGGGVGEFVRADAIGQIDKSLKDFAVIFFWAI